MKGQPVFFMPRVGQTPTYKLKNPYTLLVVMLIGRVCTDLYFLSEILQSEGKMLNKQTNIFLWTLLLLALAGLFATVSAIDTRWTGVNSSVWSDVSNWDNGIPDVGDRAIFDGIM